MTQSATAATAATASAAPPRTPTASLDPKVIVPLVNSIRAVFTTMVKVQVTIGRPSLKTNPAPSHEVSGIIGLSGDITGSIVLSFETGVAAKLVSAFAGCPLDPQSPDFPDAVGELANMIAGGAKKTFGVQANISIPSVVIGMGHVIARLSDVPCVVIPCSTELGNFAVEVNLKQLRPAKPAGAGGQS